MNQQLLTARKEKGWSIEVASARVGVSRVTYSRWENGHQEPQPTVLKMLCEAFNTSAEDLGYSHLSKEPLRAESEDDVNRREAIKRIGTTVGTTLLLVQHDLFHSDVLDRLQWVLDKPSSLDMVALSSLETLTEQNWKLLYSGLPWPTLLGGVLGHIQNIAYLLRDSQPTSVEQHLYTLLSQEAQMAGEIYFDMNDHEQARVYYQAAIRAAQRANNDPLTAVALARVNVVPTDYDQLKEMLSQLEAAHRLTKQSATVTTRSWIAAREAEVQANLGVSDACLRALEHAETVSGQYHSEDDPYRTQFGLPSLLGYKGVCFVRLRHPEKAQPVLLEALDSLPSRRATTLVDLAHSYAQQGEIDEACRRASQALMLIEQRKTIKVLQRIYNFRSELKPWASTSYVANLDRQIAATRINLIGH